MKNFPSKQEITNGFLAVFTAITFWAFVIFLHNFPGLIKQLTILEIFGVFSYTIFSALVESVIVFLLLLTLSRLLPEKLLRSEFDVRAALFLLLSMIYIIPFHVYIPRISILIFEVAVSLFIALWTVLYLIELILFHLVVERYPNFVKGVRTVLERVSVLGIIYLFLDTIAVIYIVIANWS